MGARLQNTIYDANGQDWTITVYDTEYSTTALPIDITSAKIQWQASSSERFAPVLPSVADISFRVDGAVLNAFVNDFIGAPEQRFQLTIYKGVNLFWVGNVQTDNVRKQDKEYPYIFTIRAADGLAALKDIDYNDDGTAYDASERVTEHLINALTKVGTSDLFGANFLSVAAHWYSAEHSATTVDPVHETRFNHRRFVKLDSQDNKSYSSCYDVIESICEAFGARLYLSDGAYRFVQVNQYEGNNVKYFHYASDKTSSGSTAQTLYRKTDGTDVVRLFGGSFEYYPALREVTINYNHLQAQSLIGTNDITSSDYTGDILDSQSGSSTLLISTSIKYSSSEATDALFKPLRLHIRLKVQVGAHYLTRTATSFPVSYSATTWETTPGYYEIVTPILEQNGVEYVYNITALNTPPFPFDSQLIVSGTYFAAYTPNGLPYSPSSVSIKFFNSYIEVVPSGFIEDRSNKTTYSVTNDQTDNSKRIEINTELGDGPSFNALGALQVWNGSEWVVSTGWAVDALTGTIPIGQLLAQETVKTQAFPCEIISATFNGFVSPLYTVYHDSDDYAVRQLNLDLIQGKAQGLFFECDSTGAAYTDKDEESSFEVDEEISPISPINVPIKNPVPEAQLEPTLQTFAQIQEILVTDTAIDAGDPITSIQIAPSGTDDLVKTNDVITLVDLVTGQSQEFTVTADVSGTDTEIFVTSTTAEHDFSQYSSIVFSQTDLINRINTVPTKVRYKQEFASQTGTSVTVTANGGVLPNDVDDIDVIYNGRELNTADWEKSGSAINFFFTLNGFVTVKFYVTELLLTRKKRYKQEFSNQSGTSVTITENSGVLPSSDDDIDVIYNGRELNNADWTKSGSDILFGFTLNGFVTVKFYI